MSDDANAPERPTGQPRSISVRSLLVILLALALVAAIVFAVGQRSRVSDLEAERDERTEIVTTASRFGEVYLTYDFSDPDRTGARVLELASEAFAREFEDERAPGIEELFSNLDTTTQATTTQVYVGDVTDDAAEVLVIVDVVASSGATGTQTLSGLPFLLDLVRQDGRWLVDRVNPSPEPKLTGDGIEEGPAPTTSTTAASP